VNQKHAAFAAGVLTNLPAYLWDRNAKTLWPASGDWMGHKNDPTQAVRYSALFPTCEADAMGAMVEREPIR
jgi:hypothetical protein